MIGGSNRLILRGLRDAGWRHLQIALLLLVILAGMALQGSRAAHAQNPEGSIRPDDDQPITLRFFGSTTADLFTRELEASFQGVLKENYYAQARDGFPPGFISASAPGMPWGGTMWTRDAGTFMRELVSHFL